MAQPPVKMHLVGISEKPALNKGGRPRGSKNKYASVKMDMLWVYKQMGGRKELFKWAKAHKDSQEVFYKELLRLLPKDLDVETPQGNIKLVMDLGGDKGVESADGT